MMKDRTSLDISGTFREYIEALVEDVVINGESFEAQKKWLRKNSEAEGISYETIESNLNDLFEALKELEEYESRVIERTVRFLAKECYLSEDLLNKLIDNAAAVRRQKEADGKVQEENERKAREEADCKSREDAERKEDKTPKGVTAIDLGLPSGTKWASCNIGASKPWEYGGYYAWGETEEKRFYNDDNYIHCDGSWETMHNIGNNISGTKYDVAHVKWGGKWKMPTYNQIKELIDNCERVFISLKGVEGCMFTGLNGNRIFLPAAGGRFVPEYFNDNGERGGYWSGDMSTYPHPDPRCRHGLAYILDFYQSGEARCCAYSRWLGFSVRPVATE